MVYAKPPFGGPEQVLSYLGRYTHRVAIGNSRLISLADGKVRFTWKDYRQGGKTKVMTLEADEFIPRFLLHALPDGFHRIRHYGTLANGSRDESLARSHWLLDARDTGVICERTDNRANAIARSPQPTSPSVPIAAAPCGRSQPCRARASPSHSPVAPIRVIEKLRGELVEAVVEETLTYYAFPEQHWRRIRTNNPLERILREIRRRTRVVGAFPDGQSALNLAAARLRHIAGTAWSTKRYLNIELLKDQQMRGAIIA